VADESGEKTEEPTPKKLEDARKKGQVAKSRDMTGALVFMAGFFVMGAAFPLLLERSREAFLLSFQKVSLGAALSAEDIAHATYAGLWATVALSLPVVVAGAMVGALADFVQVGALFTLEPLTPKLEKLNPFEGMKNLFSEKQLVELLKAAAKMLLAGYVAWGVLRDELRVVAETARAGPDLILLASGHVLYKLTTRIALLFVLFALFDLWWQRRVYMKDMRMTKEEVKREYKESEGDPHHKARRREMHQEILEGAMMEDVASADVVITNPTHLAVALRYDRARDGAPRVLAKGVGAWAARVKERARALGIPTVEDVPLARALFAVEVGEEIPESLYDGVAAVLSFVYAQQRRREVPQA
jgi:flagellar biosynthetic protein FlhB